MGRPNKGCRRSSRCACSDMTRFHVSVGHVARAFEEAGIPSVIIMSTAFKDRTTAMNPARILLTPNPMGRPLSAPFDAEKQRDVLKAALSIVESATQGGTVVNYEPAYRTVMNEEPTRVAHFAKNDRMMRFSSYKFISARLI